LKPPFSTQIRLTGEGRGEQDIEEAKVFSKSRCPHTGVVNFFTKADPLLSIGSVAEAGASARYVWRCYIGEETCGHAPDMPSAEARLRSAIAGDQQRLCGKRLRKAATATRPSRASSYWQKLNAAAAAIGPNRTPTQ
jgi:hypothetical protein